MNRRGFLAALSALPFMKWVNPKDRASKVDVYFSVDSEVKFPPPSLDGKPIFARYENRTGNVISIEGIPYNSGDWVEFEKVLRAWSNG